MKGSDAIGLGLSLMISPTTICTDWADNNHLIWSQMSYQVWESVYVCINKRVVRYISKFYQIYLVGVLSWTS